MPCLTSDDGTVTICGPGATEEVVRRDDGERWCFQCRARVPFQFVVTRDVEPSYYEPNPSIRCAPKGHYDGDVGFGAVREWES